MHFDKEYIMQFEDMMNNILRNASSPEDVYRARMMIPHLSSSCAGTVTLTR